MTLTDFLLARIAEDEAVARECSPPEWPAARWAVDDGLVVDAETEAQVFPGGGINYDQVPDPSVATHVTRHHPARVLAECEAKRQLIALYDAEQPRAEKMYRDAVERADAYFDAIQLAALPYADHPDYQVDWRP